MSQIDGAASQDALADHPCSFAPGLLAGRTVVVSGGGSGTIAMAAAGVVCLQEFGQYDDWRIEKNMIVIGEAIRPLNKPRGRDGTMPTVANAPAVAAASAASASVVRNRTGSPMAQSACTQTIRASGPPRR